MRAIGDYASHSYIIYDTEGKPHPVPPNEKTGIEERNGGPPDAEINPQLEAGPNRQLADHEREEIVAGQEAMDAILAKVVAGAREQAAEQMDPGIDEDDVSSVADDEIMIPFMNIPARRMQ